MCFSIMKYFAFGGYACKVAAPFQGRHQHAFVGVSSYDLPPSSLTPLQTRLAALKREEEAVREEAERLAADKARHVRALKRLRDEVRLG
jgi:hypothetical protein